MKILSDVNLYSIEFSPNGRNIFFNFSDLTSNIKNVTIECGSVYLFNYHNTFSDNEGFASYVGEVTCNRVNKIDAKKLLTENNFRFKDKTGAIFVPENELVFMSIEGGEISIDLVCELIKLNDIELEIKIN